MAEEKIMKGCIYLIVCLLWINCLRAEEMGTADPSNHNAEGCVPETQRLNEASHEAIDGAVIEKAPAVRTAEEAKCSHGDEFSQDCDPAFSLQRDGESEALEAMRRGDDLLAAGHLSKALDAYRSVNRRFPFSNLAPEALKKRGIVYLKQHRFQSAFNCFQRIVDKYPNYENFLEILQLEFDTAQALMDGKRHYFWGKIPGFKDRGSALRFFQKIVDQAPYGDIAPKALMNIAHLGMRIREPEKSIEALERVIDEYSNSPFASEAQLLLAKVRRKMVIGPAYDQRATEEAVNCYREFLILYPDSPQVPDAEQGLEEARDLLAASKLNMGNFYYHRRQNPRAALMYYQEVLSIAPESQAAKCAQESIARIKSGKRGKGTPLDFILGHYRNSQPSDELDLVKLPGDEDDSTQEPMLPDDGDSSTDFDAASDGKDPLVNELLTDDPEMAADSILPDGKGATDDGLVCRNCDPSDSRDIPTPTVGDVPSETAR